MSKVLKEQGRKIVLQDAAAERAILSSFIQHGKDAYYSVSDIIDISCFVDINNQFIYKCLSHILESDKTVDVPTILSSANDIGILEQINNTEQMTFIRSLFNMPVKKENARKHAIKIKKLQIGRLAQEKHRDAYSCLSEIDGTETIDEILSISEKPLLELSFSLNSHQEDRPIQIAEGGKELLEQLISNPVTNIGIPTPFPRYNKVIGGGLRNGGVNLIAARPKQGKTTIGKEVALHVGGKLKIPTLFLDTEMVKDDQYFRSLASISKVPINRIETGQFGQNEIEKSRVFKADELLQSMFYKHKAIAGKSFDEIIAIIRRWILQDVGYNADGAVKPCLVIYDYFKIMNEDSMRGMEEYQALGFQISKLSDFCKLYQFPVLAFVQVNRDGVTKETSDIISGSDRLLWLCHSLSVWKRKTKEEIENDSENGNMKLIPLEARFGSSLDEGDYIHFTMDGEKSMLSEGKTFKETKREQLEKLNGQNESIEL